MSVNDSSYPTISIEKFLDKLGSKKKTKYDWELVFNDYGTLAVRIFDTKTNKTMTTRKLMNYQPRNDLYYIPSHKFKVKVILYWFI